MTVYYIYVCSVFCGGFLAIFALKYAMHLAIMYTQIIIRVRNKYVYNPSTIMLLGCRLSFAWNLWLRSSFKAIKVICVIFLFSVCTTKIYEIDI